LKEIATAAGTLSAIKKAGALEGLNKSQALYDALKPVKIATIRGYHPELITAIKAGDPEDSLGFAKAIALDQAVTDFTKSVDALYDAGKLDEILSGANDLLQKEGLSALQKQILLFTKANVFYEKKDTVRALATLNELIAIDPESDLADEAKVAKKELE